MADRINKEFFIANILECFTLLQTYEECYKEILDIIDVINGLNESDLTVENLQKLVEGSEYISLDLNQAGTKLVISLDRTHVDETVKEDSPNLVTSGAVFDAVANANGKVLKLPIDIPTEPLVVMVGTNNAQTNVPLGDGLAIVNNHLVATGGGGTSDVTKEYVDSQDAKLQQSINATDAQVQKLNEEVSTIKTDTIPTINNNVSTLNDQLVSTNTEVAKKLDKATTTSGSYAYVRNGTKDETMPVNPLVGKDAIVRRTSTGTIKANAGVDENDCINKKQLDDAIAGVSGGGAQLNVANTWTAVQTFDAGITVGGSISIGGQGNINIIGGITCDGNLTLAGGDILQGGTGNFSSLVTSFGDGGLNFTTTKVPLGDYIIFKTTYKYSGSMHTDTYKVTTTKHGATKTIITNEDINTNDFTWNTVSEKLELNTRIVYCDQTSYDNLATKDKATLYVIVE